MLNKRGRPSYELSGATDSGGAPTGVEQAAGGDACISLRAEDSVLVLPSGAPATRTEWATYQRVKYDCTPYQEARAVACIVESGAGVLGMDFGTTDVSFSPMSYSGDVQLSLTGSGTVAGTWMVLKDVCIGDCYFRWWTDGGSGTHETKIGNVYLQFRANGNTRRSAPPAVVPLIFDTFQAYTSTAQMNTAGYQDSPYSVPLQVNIIDMFWNGGAGTLATSGSCDGTQYVTWSASFLNQSGMISGVYPKLTSVWARVRIRISALGPSAADSITLLEVDRSDDSKDFCGIEVQLQTAGLQVFWGAGSFSGGGGVVKPASIIQLNEWMDVIIFAEVASSTTIHYQVWIGRTDGTGGWAIVDEQVVAPPPVTGSTPPTGPLGWGDNLQIACATLDTSDTATIDVCNWEVVDGSIYTNPFGLS